MEKDKSYIPFLPQLKDNNNIANFDKPGEWLDRDPVQLEYIASGIEDTKTIVESYEVLSAIPDVWARPLLFEMALYDKFHPLHNHIKGEWRGLLAMLALKERLSININVKELVLPENEDDLEEYQIILYKSIPQKSISNDTTWRKIYLIYFNDEPIGITSPTTLVCTSINYRNKIDVRCVNWADARYLKDPTNHLDSENKLALCSWLKKVKEDLIAYHNTDKNLLNKLTDELSSFIDDVDCGQDIVLIEFSGNKIGLHTGIFRVLDRTIGKPPKKPSDVMLIKSQGKTPNQEWLIIDRTIPNQWNLQPRDIYVIDGFTMDSVDRVLRNADHFQGVKIKLKDDIFTEELTLLDLGERALPGSVEIKGADNLRFRDKGVTPILPIRSEVLEHLNENEIVKGLRFEQQGDNIIVRFELKLFKNKITLEKNYDPDHFKIIRDIPILQLWPYIFADEWKIYYLFVYYYIKEDTLQFKPVQKQADRTYERQEGMSFEFYKLNRFPETLECLLEDGTFAGLIIQKKPQTIVVDQLKQWYVAIDFGTVNTTVFIKKSQNSEPEKFLFNGKFVFQIAGIGKEAQARIRDKFIPIEDEKVPFASFLHIHKGSSFNEPILDNHILFIAHNIGTDEEVEQNLKWAEESQQRIKLKAFLTQLIYHILAQAKSEGVNTIEWRYAYPSSFSQEDINDYTNYLETTLKASSVKELTGINTLVYKPFTESVAGANFFEMAIPGLISIDIGGGTTDISVWQKNKLIYQTSIIFAGRDIFEKKAREDSYYKFLVKIIEEATKWPRIKDTLEEVKKDDKKFTFALYYFLKEYEDKIFDCLNIFTKEPIYKEFYKNLFISLAGIFYYVGLIVKFLIEKNFLQKDFITLPIAGNGSKLLKWLQPTNTNIELLKNIFKKASGTEDFEFQITQNPKEEVAIGLLKNTEQLIQNPANDNPFSCLAGEYFFRNGDELSPLESITANDLIKYSITVKDLKELKTYLNLVNELTKLNLGAKLNWNQMIALVKERLGRMKGQSNNKIRFEPIFFTGLRVLIDQLENKKS